MHGYRKVAQTDHYVKNKTGCSQFLGCTALIALALLILGWFSNS